MRMKRVQRRRQRAVTQFSPYALPDPFSLHNEDLVHDEVALQDTCPCCRDRQIELEFAREERAYLDWRDTERSIK